MEDMNQQMDEIERPPVEDLDMDIGDYVAPSDVSLVNSHFGAITNHSMVVTMLMLSLTVALVAYILFGKR